MVEFTFTSQSSLGQVQPARTLWYFIWLPKEPKSVLLQFNVFLMPGEPSLEGTFKRFEKLFEAVAFSFTLGDKPVAGAVANPQPEPAAPASSRPAPPAPMPASRPDTASPQPNWNRAEEQRQYEERRRRDQQRLEEEQRQAEQRRQQGQWQRQQEEQRRRDQERLRQQRKPGWY